MAPQIGSQCWLATNTAVPICSRSPSQSTSGSWIRRPLTKVPLVLLRSLMKRRFSRQINSAWLPETVPLARQRLFSGRRPIVKEGPEMRISCTGAWGSARPLRCQVTAGPRYAGRRRPAAALAAGAAACWPTSAALAETGGTLSMLMFAASLFPRPGFPKKSRRLRRQTSSSMPTSTAIPVLSTLPCPASAWRRTNSDPPPRTGRPDRRP